MKKLYFDKVTKILKITLEDDSIIPNKYLYDLLEVDDDVLKDFEHNDVAILDEIEKKVKILKGYQATCYLVAHNLVDFDYKNQYINEKGDIISKTKEEKEREELENLKKNKINELLSNNRIKINYKDKDIYFSSDQIYSLLLALSLNKNAILLDSSLNYFEIDKKDINNVLNEIYNFIINKKHEIERTKEIKSKNELYGHKDNL